LDTIEKTHQQYAQNYRFLIMAITKIAHLVRVIKKSPWLGGARAIITPFFFKGVGFGDGSKEYATI
jgi:hypothetical protein